jgi:hypothetical protein
VQAPLQYFVLPQIDECCLGPCIAVSWDLDCAHGATALFIRVTQLFVRHLTPQPRVQLDEPRSLRQTHVMNEDWASQDSVDTSASSSGSFEFLRTYAA